MNGPRRWIGYLALVVLFAVVCGLLSWWQFSRNAEAEERIRQVAENWDAAPVAVESLLPETGAVLDPADTWTPMRLVGMYDVDGTHLVRNRPHDGKPGFEVLVPLVLDEGGVVIVDRGWVPAGQSQAEVPDSVPAPPAGRVEVIARVKTGEPAVPGRDAPVGQIATIELPRLAELLGRADVYTGAYGLLASESPTVPTPTLANRPEPDPGPHLSYAIQWIIFAVLAAGALAWTFLNERRVRRMSVEERVEDAARRRQRRIDRDAAAEDALLDA